MVGYLCFPLFYFLCLCIRTEQSLRDARVHCDTSSRFVKLNPQFCFHVAMEGADQLVEAGEWETRAWRKEGKEIPENCSRDKQGRMVGKSHKRGGEGVRERDIPFLIGKSLQCWLCVTVSDTGQGMGRANPSVSRMRGKCCMSTSQNQIFMKTNKIKCLVCSRDRAIVKIRRVFLPTCLPVQPKVILLSF